MSEPIKLIVGPSVHYHQLKSGQIKYQKSKPAHPIWRILLIDEGKNLMHIRVFARQPSAEDIDKVVMGLPSDGTLLGTDIVIPTRVERLCPGLQEKLMAHGLTVYVPAHGFSAGVLAIKQSDEFLASLETLLRIARESMASCEEIAAATGNPLGVVTTTLWRDDGKDGGKATIALKMAHDITRLRGRDPEVGWITRKNESSWAPLNKGKYVPPHEDVLATLLSNPHHLPETGFWDVVLQLKKIKDAEPEQELPLIQELGALVVRHQITRIRRRRWSFLSSLDFYLRDESLRYLVSLGMKEAFKMLIVLDEGLLQVSASRVDVHYPQDCVDLTLRGIPAHHHLEKVIQQLSGGKVAVLPYLTNPNPATPEFLRAGGPFGSLWFSARTPLSPAQCLIPVAVGGSQRGEGLLIVLAILSKDTATYLPIEDHKLAMRMTALINERLARTGKGIACHIKPLQSYGDLMEIGSPPHSNGVGSKTLYAVLEER